MKKLNNSSILQNLLVLFLLTICTATFAQTNMEKIEKLKALGKDSLIAMATERILSDDKFTGFDPANYDTVNVYIDGDNLYMVFKMDVLYSPMNSSYIYSVVVHLTDGSLSWSPLTNPKEKTGENSHTFYKPGIDQQNAISFIYGSDNAPKGAQITIYENPDFYDVHEMWHSSAALYKVDKNDHRIYDEIYEELAPEPDDNSIYEIK